MPSTSATIDSSGSIQPSSASSAAPSGQDHARPELRGVDGGDADGRHQRARHETFRPLAVRRGLPPGQSPVGRGGVGEHPALAGLHQHQDGLERHRRLVGRPARGVEHLGDQRPPVRHGHLERVLVPRDRLQPVAALVELGGERLLVRLDDGRRSRRSVGHHGRGCFSQPAASAPSTNWRSPVNGATCRRPRAKAGSSHSLRISAHASTIWSREAITTARRARRVERGPFAGPAQLPRSASSWAARARSPSVSRERQPGEPRPTAHQRPADVAVGDPERPPHRALVLDRGLHARPRAAARAARPGRGRQAAASRAPARPRPARARAAGPAGPRRARPPGPPGRRTPRSAAASCWPSSRPGRARRRGQNRVRL